MAAMALRDREEESSGHSRSKDMHAGSGCHSSRARKVEVACAAPAPSMRLSDASLLRSTFLRVFRCEAGSAGRGARLSPPVLQVRKREDAAIVILRR